MRIKAVFLTSIMLLSVGCASVYRSPNFYEMREGHRLVAILPFDVSISSARLPKGMTVEMLRELEKDEGYTTQALFYSRFLARSGDFTVEFQDVDRTNTILLRNDLDYESIRMMLKTEIADLLGVDAVISGKIQRESPMSEAAALALGIVFGFFGSTKKVNVDFNIHDGQTGNLFWKYNHQVSGSIGSSSEQLVKSLTRKIARTFPYSIHAR